LRRKRKRRGSVLRNELLFLAEGRKEFARRMAFDKRKKGRKRRDKFQI